MTFGRAQIPLLPNSITRPQSPPDSVERTLQIAAEQTRLLYAQAPTGFVVTVLNSGILVIVLRSVIALHILFTWFALMIAVAAGRAALVWLYYRAAPLADQHRRWRRRFLIGVCGAGLTWGSAGIFLFAADSQAHQIFLAFVLGGMITGAVAMLSWVEGAFVAFLLPAALPIIVQFFIHGGDIFMAMGVLSVIFIAALLTTSRYLHASVTESLALRFEKGDLVYNLSLSESQTAAANIALREEISERTRVEEALRTAHSDLEVRVQERTAELSRINATLEDEIAARTQAERALQRERDLLEVTLASIGDAVIATDPSATLTFMNPVAEALTGWSAQEAVGRHINEVFYIFNEQSRQVMENPLEKVLHDQVIAGLMNHTVLIARNGKEVPIADSGAPIRNKDGQVYGAVMVFRDITERQQAEAALLQAKEAAEAANRAKSEFLATMSHELRTPLSIVIGYTDLLIEGVFGRLDDDQSEVLERIKRNAHELYELIAAILDLSRLEAGRLPLDVKEVCIADLLDELKKETEEVRARSGLQFVWHIEANLAPVYTDPGKLKVTLKNLLGNAIKFTQEGSITIDAHTHRHGLEICVTDTGMGIPQDALSLIFEPFRQIETAEVHQQGGTGLGLHIVKRLLELLGGEVKVESEEGRGSTFRVWIPVSRETVVI